MNVRDTLVIGVAFGESNADHAVLGTGASYFFSQAETPNPITMNTNAFHLPCLFPNRPFIFFGHKINPMIIDGFMQRPGLPEKIGIHRTHSQAEVFLTIEGLLQHKCGTPSIEFFRSIPDRYSAHR